MVAVDCFCSSWWKRKSKGQKIQPPATIGNTLHVEVNHLQNSFGQSRSTPISVPVPFHHPIGNSRSRVKIMGPVAPHPHPHPHPDPVEVDYEAEDEHDNTQVVKSYSSHVGSQAFHEKSNEGMKGFCFQNPDDFDTINSQMDNGIRDQEIEMIGSGHISDPGNGKAEFLASPQLKRSCSSLAMTSIWVEPPPEKKKRLSEIYGTSPAASVRSADNVILKKHSSSQVLPSRSRRLWWKLFLWSHRNLDRIQKIKPQLPIEALNQQGGGYASDSVEVARAMDSSKLRESGGDDHRWEGFHGSCGVWQHNQWVAFPVNMSPLERVNEWIAESSKHPHNNLSPDNTPMLERDSMNLIQQQEEISHANAAIRSLNANSTVAHIAGIGLKVIPLIAHFHSLGAVNLSSNFIVHIAPRSLPKGLHVLNLSRNKICAVEGLRELTRLRVLDLSYNRISSIGQGLSSCTQIKELYLAGNRVSSVEGLHRLSKLTVLDLSFNKITTEKSLAQLVANYCCLIAVNLVGNPIHSNMSDNHLKKMVCSLLPKLALLNKQPVNREKGRHTLVHANATGQNSQRRGTRRRAANVGNSTTSARRSTHVRSSHKLKQRLLTEIE